jgi:hypothetical protein
MLVTGPVSRILSATTCLHPLRGKRRKTFSGRTVIPLGGASLRALISDLPGSSDAPSRCVLAISTLARFGRRPSLFGLAPCGVCLALAIAGGTVRSYRTFSPLPVAGSATLGCVAWRRRYFFCGTGRQLGFNPNRPGVTWHTALWSSDFPLPNPRYTAMSRR